LETPFLRIFCAVFFTLLCSLALAQPNISYSPSSNVYNPGVAITTLTPANSGGAVAGQTYNTSTTFASITGTPFTVATDLAGNVYSADESTGDLYKYTSAGVRTTLNSTTLTNPLNVGYDNSTGYIYVSDFGTNSVYRFNSSGTLLATITGFTQPYGLAIDQSGNVFVANNGGSSVKKIAAGASTATTFISSLTSPYGVTFDASGNLYISSNTANTILKVPAGTSTAGAFVSTGLSGPRNLAYDGAGNIYVADYGNNAIKKITSAGTVSTFYTSNVTSPRDISFGPNGTIYIANSGGNNLLKATTKGGYYIDNFLPLGLSFNAVTGVISGTPTTLTLPTTYTITAWNASGSSSTSLTLAVSPPAPTAGGVSICGAGTVTITASGGSPAGGTYNWYATAVSTPALQSTTSTTYSPAVTATTTYYVSYTSSGCESTRTAVTATVNAQPILSTVPTTPAAGLYLSYPFNGNANDVSGNSNTGTVQGAASLTADRYNAGNSAYSFNGTTQYISTTTLVASPGPQTFSISVWINTTTTTGGKIVGFGSSNTGLSGNYDRHIYMNNAGQIYFGIYNTALSATQTISTAAAYNDGAWHHIVATLSTTNGMRLYVDGAFVSYNTSYTTPQAYAGYWRIGYDNLSAWPSAPTSSFFKGSIDDVAIYNSEVTPATVYALNGAGSSPVCVGSTLTLQANTVAGATYAWTGPLGFTSTLQNPTIANATTANAGLYTVTVTGANGCQSVEVATAVVNTLPSALFTATSVVDVGVNATITYTGTDPVTSTYAWDFNGGTPASGTGQGPFTVSWATSGVKTITLTVTNAGTCSTIFTKTVVVNGTSYSTYAYRIPLTLNTTGLGSSTDLTNFPFLVTITDPGLVYTVGGCSNKVQYPNGPAYDFSFVDAAAGEVPYQVESYNQATGTLLVWVKLPTLSHTQNNTLSFYYGSAASPAAHTTAFYQTTWASDYQAVYHFNEGTYTGSVTDATSNAHTGTTSGMTSADLVSTGKVNSAYTFNGSTKKITANAVTLTGSFTLSAWVKLGATGIDQKIMTNQGAAGGSTGGYKMAVYSTNQPESESGTATNRASTPTAPTLAASTWYYVQSVYTGAQLTTYVNGVQYKVLATANNPSAVSPLYIGVGQGGSTLYFNGTIDEARVSNVGKTTDWLLAEYNNQNNPAAFTTLGTSTTNFTNASAILGGITYSTADGISYTYTINSTTTGATPPNDGTASFVITGTNVPNPATASIYALTVNATDKLDLNGQTLNVGCNIINNGTITNTSVTASNLNFIGSGAAQTYTGSGSSVATFDNVTINNSAAGTVTITGGAVSVKKSLTLTKGNLIIDNVGGGALTLKSTATQSAYVAAIPAAYSITGTVAVERFITGGAGYRGYRLLSSPIYGSTVSSNNVYTLNHLKNSSYLTGTTGVGGGFDKAGNPTLYLYRENMAPSNATFISGNFRGVNTLGTAPNYSYLVDGDGASPFNIPVGNGFLFFFRGDRSITTLTAETTTSYVPTNTTLSTSGTLSQQQVVVHTWYTPASAYLGYTTATANTAVRGFNLVGNPYASSIDWETFNTTTPTSGIYGNNVGTTIYELNPATKNYDTYQKGGVHTNNGSNVIVSGEGFFVQASSVTNPQLIFNESAKVATQSTGLNLFMADRTSVAKVNSTNIDQHLRLQLAQDTINKDDIYIGFNSTATKNYVFNEDADYKTGSGVLSLASISGDHVPLAINRLPLKKTDTIPLKVNAAATGLYKLNMTELQAIPMLYDIWLMDAYKKDSLDMRHNATYAFNIITADTNTFGSKRFSLVIRQNQALGLHLLDFAASKAATGAQIIWKTENEQNYTNFTVERSTDGGVTYTVIGSLASSAQGAYNFLDSTPLIAANQYRLKLEDYNGDITYSKPVVLMYANINAALKNAVNIYPNPSVSTINLSIDPLSGANASAGQGTTANINTVYGIKIVSNTGALIKSATTTQQNWQTDISALMPGTYIIQVVNNENKSVVGKGTFVKL
jgi:sugar lactone lactonase YvrE